MRIERATIERYGKCARCGGSGVYSQQRLSTCWRCGGSGRQAAEISGRNVDATVMRSRTIRGGSRAGERNGTIDVVAIVDVVDAPRPNRGYGTRSVYEVIVETRVVGRMVDGTAFDKTIRVKDSTIFSERDFAAARDALVTRVRNAVGLRDDLTANEERAILVELGLIDAAFVAA